MVFQGNQLALPLIFLLAFSDHMKQALGQFRENKFEKIHLCSDTLPGTETVAASSRMSCAVSCAYREYCTALSYLADGTCKLHRGNMASHTCSSSLASVAHYQKVTASQLCQNGGSPINDNTACRCVNGYIGDYCERLMIDCSEGLQSGHYPSMRGLYLALPSSAPAPVTLLCDQYVHTIVFERWMDDINFNATMTEYVSGMGSDQGDYWVGLETLHLITSNPYNYNFGIQIANFSSNPFYQHYYLNFRVKSAAEGYAMTFTAHVAGSSPAAPMGDCLSPLINLPFSTYENDNDNNPSRNCAADYGCGWWYGVNCSECNLFGTLRWNALTRVPGAVDEVFWLPGVDPPDFSPFNANAFLYRL